MNKSRNSRTLAILALVLATIGMSVAFAALSQTLTINGMAKLKGSTWSILFANLSNPTLVGNATVEKAASLDSSSTTLTFEVLLKQPGDKVTYTFDVKNEGSIDAKVSSINLTGVTEALEKNVLYTLTYANGSDIKVGDTLNAEETKGLKLEVEFDSNATSVIEEDVTLALGATIIYIQQ